MPRNPITKLPTTYIYLKYSELQWLTMANFALNQRTLISATVGRCVIGLDDHIAKKLREG